MRSRHRHFHGEKGSRKILRAGTRGSRCVILVELVFGDIFMIRTGKTYHRAI